MKKVLFISIIVLLLFLGGCKGNTDSNKKLSINYYDNDTLVYSKEYTGGVKVFNYTKSDSVFIGWYLDKDFTQKFDSSNLDQYYELESINLYAKFEKTGKKIIVNYYDGDTLIESKEYIREIDEYNYSKPDYRFIGWYLDKNFSQAFDSSNTEQYFENESLNLYAKMGQYMKDLKIKVNGEINNSAVLNPAFTWNDSGDTSYSVSLLLNNEVVETAEVNKPLYQVKKLLNVNSNYEFVVLGKDSNYQEKISFKTIQEYSNSINSISIANPFDNGMVIQRNADTIIAGNGPVKQLITLSIESENYFAVSDENGYFEVTLPARNASFTPVNLSLTNGIDATKEITDVLFGDVYLFAGQSNMQWPTKDSDYTANDINELTKANVRFFCQDVTTATSKQESVKNGRWFKPTTSNCSYFSAIATMSGAFLGKELKDIVPIGIVTAYQGDTNIANWMGSEYYQGKCQTKYLHYNAMVYPLRHTKLSGVVWYQGCNNSSSGSEYKDLLLDLFRNYRELFNTADLPFFIIGLACYDGDSGNNFDFSFVRESQALACDEDDNAYFISTCDDGDPTYIHPRAKRYICERVSKSICSAIYNKDYYSEGPSYKSHTVNGNVVTIELNNASGLRASGPITNLYLAGEDGKYFEASATIEGEKIVATCEKVANPVYIKYGFGKSPFVNIFNKDNFAITPFRTDEYNTDIDLFDYNSIADYYFHPDGSKMEIAINGKNLAITKTSDGKGYGSVRLDKWGAVAYQPQGFEFTIKGTNSGASIAIRFIEGDSYEIWGYKITDNFTEEKTFSIGVGDLTVMYNKQNNIFEPQKIGYMEIMVECSGAASFELCGAKFVSVARSKPLNFMISSVVEESNSVSVSLSKAIFGEDYDLVITSDNSTNPIYSSSNKDGSFIIDKSLLEVGIPYYISAISRNELGSTPAINDGYVFYLKDENKVIVCNFDFKDQESLNAYIDSSMSVHNGLTCTLEENGVKIASGDQGWQQFIFKLDTGAGNGMSKLIFTADFSNYKGSVVMQLADTGWKTYGYTLNLSEKNSGVFTIDFNQFMNGSTPFTTQTLMWVMFNFSDSVGNGYILLDDVSLSK